MSDTIGFQAPVDFRLPLNPPTGIQDPVVASAINDMYISLQQIFQAFVQNCGIGPQPNQDWTQLSGNPGTILAQNMNRLYVPAVENILTGAAVHLITNSGVLFAQNANATDHSKPAHGFNNSNPAVANQMMEVIIGCGLVNVNGLTPGFDYYLSTTSGEIASGPATAAGNIEQYLGVAISTTELFFNQHYWIKH